MTGVKVRGGYFIRGKLMYNRLESYEKEIDELC